MASTIQELGLFQGTGFNAKDNPLIASKKPKATTRLIHNGVTTCVAYLQFVKAFGF